MKPDFNFQITNLLFLLIPLIKALIDVYLFEKKGKPVNHTASMTAAVVGGLLLSLVDFRLSEVSYYFQSCLMALGVFWLLFDYVRNVFAGKTLFYVDGNPQSDEVEDSWWDVNVYSKMTPLTLLFAKVWVMMLTYGTYYHLSWII